MKIKDLHELAEFISKRDKISLYQAEEMIATCQLDMKFSFENGNLDGAEAIMEEELNLTPDYMGLFIN